MMTITTITSWSSSPLAGGKEATRGKGAAQMTEMTMMKTRMTTKTSMTVTMMKTTTNDDDNDGNDDGNDDGGNNDGNNNGNDDATRIRMTVTTMARTTR
jgi:hypothetical protein